MVSLPLLAHLAGLALWPWATRVLGWPLALTLAVLYLCSGRSAGAGAEREAPTAPPSSDSPSSDWLNALLSLLWPRCLAPLLCRLAVQQLNPRLDAAQRPGWLSSLCVSRFALGSASPVLTQLRCKTSEDAVTLSFHVGYAATADMKLSLDARVAPGGIPVPLTLSKLRLAGDAEMTLTGLSPRFPWVSRLRCAFVEVPKASFSVAHAHAGGLDVAQLPVLSSWLEAQLHAALQHVSEPQARTLCLAARCGDAVPKALLSVTVHAARGLPALTEADPFVRLALHAQSAETGVRRRMVTPDWNDQRFSFTVFSWERARLRVDVLGWQPRGPATRLGCCVLDLRSALVNHGLPTDGTPCRLTLPLAGSAHGELELSLQLQDLHAGAAAEADAPRLPPAPKDGAMNAHEVGLLGGGRAAGGASPDASTLPVKSSGETPLPPPLPEEPSDEPSEESHDEPSDEPSASDVSLAVQRVKEAEENQEPPAVAPPSATAPSAPASPFAFSLCSPDAAGAPDSVAVLEVTVLRAARLPADVASDPYIRLQLGHNSCDTGVRRRMIDPCFDGQRFRLPLRSWAARHAVLRVTALGWLPNGHEPHFLGAAQVPVRPLAAEWAQQGGGSEPHSCEVLLQGVPHGQVTLQLALRQLRVPPPPEEPPEGEGDGEAAVEDRLAPASAGKEAQSAEAQPPAVAATDAHGFVEILLDTPAWALTPADEHTPAPASQLP